MTRAEAWRWSSLWRRVSGREDGLLPAWPVAGQVDWPGLANRPQSVAEEEALRRSIARGRPFGSASFEAWTVDERGLSPGASINSAAGANTAGGTGCSRRW